MSEVLNEADTLTTDQVIVQTTAQTAEPTSSLTGSTSQFWKVFGSTFITIFLAELGDKTQVATLLMSAESHAPWSVFTGAAIALINTSLLGVLVGQWLSSRVSPRTLDIAAGLTLALLSIAMLWDAVGL
ncbi:MAG: TMEM165/GDT1 family protein [Lyngbya sp. HA4199-MV5]|jgi:putative Ca2+/H+ antiporter (TMEM165/GDT1 family)|nr:TMEM165/GDT1 family protein [Lyngbya sp. HA4199-MV5]